MISKKPFKISLTIIAFKPSKLCLSGKVCENILRKKFIYSVRKKKIRLHIIFRYFSALIISETLKIEKFYSRLKNKVQTKQIKFKNRVEITI
jgi:hypothetical protein